MDYRRMGRTGLEVSPLCLGTMAFGGKTPEDEGIRIVHRALDAGVNFIDTANVYGRGAAEEIVGKALAERRHEAVVVTKVFGQMGEGPNQGGLGRGHIMAQAEASLERLRTDYIDLYLAHFPYPSVDLNETLKAFEDLVRQGKVRYVGCSNHAAFQIATAHRVSDRWGWAHYQCVQNRYALIARQTELEVLPYCRQEGVGVMAYAPLGAGFLSGKYRAGQAPPEGSRYAAGSSDQWPLVATEANWRILAEVEAVARARGATVAQIALAWVIGHPDVTAPVAGVTSVEQLEDNLGALSQALSEEERERLDGASRHALGVYRYHSGGGAHLLQPWPR